eukprot:208486_1
MAVNAHTKTDSKMSTNKNNNYFTKQSQYTESVDTESVDTELFIVQKHNSLNSNNTVEPSTIIEDLIITKTKLSKHEFCRRMKQQCNLRFYDAIKLWKKYNQQLQPEGYSNDKNNIITNSNNNNNNNGVSKFNQKQIESGLDLQSDDEENN